MRLVRQLNFRTERGATLAALWSRIVAAANAAPALFGETIFFMEDLPGGRQSGCETAVREMPQLAPLLRIPGRGRQHRSLSNSLALHEPPDSPAPSCDWRTVAECLAAGIPRRFPCRFALLMRCWSP